ncbi:hypothetical protein [Halogeometricum sp. CBA1124]|uniref:hypothetical protein n=1 Tax=Halogeometricum sp. CBA1124 TaxID=2668071 RepID=UPI00142B6318|nr:hypothetical protein [Halogeometricum sp. CBA1124]MUV56103.1 hypothetical protein [Halogeometricum sp. CBA1124]
MTEDLDDGIEEFVDWFENQQKDRLIECHDFDSELIEVSYEEMPLTKQGGIDAREYRLAVVGEFIESSGVPEKQKDGQAFRSSDQSRLERAFTRVAKVYDRCETTIREACVHSIYSGEKQTEQFLNDLLRIERRLKDIER